MFFVGISEILLSPVWIVFHCVQVINSLEQRLCGLTVRLVTVRTQNKQERQHSEHCGNYETKLHKTYFNISRHLIY